VALEQQLRAVLVIVYDPRVRRDAKHGLSIYVRQIVYTRLDVLVEAEDRPQVLRRRMLSVSARQTVQRDFPVRRKQPSV
jgi:hypothetical protein